MNPKKLRIAVCAALCMAALGMAPMPAGAASIKGEPQKAAAKELPYAVLAAADETTYVPVYGTIANGAMMAIGDSTSAIGDNSIAVGYNAKADSDQGYSAVAVGSGVEALGENAVALGSGAKAKGSLAVAVGASVEAANAGAMAVGVAARASGMDSTAVGKNVVAGGTAAIAIGRNTLVNDPKASADSPGIDYSQYFKNAQGIAIGDGVRAFGEQVIAIGTASRALGDDTIAIGQVSKAMAKMGVAIGNGSLVDTGASYSVAVGEGAKVNKDASNSAAFGPGALVSSASALAVGTTAQVGINSKQAVAIGNYAKVTSSPNSIAAGYRSQVSSGSDNSIAIGQSSSIGQGAKYSIAIGGSDNADSTMTEQGAKIGKDSIGSVVIGAESYVSANTTYASALGHGASVGSGASNSVAIGAKSSVFKGDILASYQSKGAWDASESGDGDNGVVSVGKKSPYSGSFNRRIINVANGRVSSTSHDAVNGSQLRNYYVPTGTYQFKDGKVTLTWKDMYGIDKDFTTDLTIEGLDTGGDVNITGDRNMTIHHDSTKEDDPYQVTLNNTVKLGAAGEEYKKLGIEIDGTPGEIGKAYFGGEEEGIKINWEKDGNSEHVHTITGLDNLTWDYTAYQNNAYKNSSRAASEAQLHAAFRYLDNSIQTVNNRIDDIEINGDKNIEVNKKDPETSGGGTGTGGTGSGSTAPGTGPKFDQTLEDDVVIGGGPDGKSGNEGSITVLRQDQGTVVDGQRIDITLNKDNDGKLTGLSNRDWDIKKYKEGGYNTSNAATEDQLRAGLDMTVQYDTKIDADGNTVIDNENITLNPGGNSVTIHNVAPGKEDTDAVNVSQLKEVEQNVNSNTTAINNLYGRVDDLGGRINKVGAGAAALAALHPLDFDPDEKLDFAAGYGNYAGENAVAIGAFYRPNEDTMFSIGGTFGNGENMVNAGISFKLGQQNRVSVSRVALAKEVIELRKRLDDLTSVTADMALGRALDLSKIQLFPDTPENHWAYDYVATLAGNGILEGYPDGYFKGNRNMTRYEMAAVIYRAMQNGARITPRLLAEFAPELDRIRVDTITKEKNGMPDIQRVRTIPGRE